MGKSMPKKTKKKPRKSSTLKDPRQSMKKQESRRYDQGNMFRIPGMSALDLFMNEAAANTEARKLKSGNESVDSGSGSENRDDEQMTTQPRMKHAKSAAMNKTAMVTKKKKRPKESKSAKRQSASVTSSSKKKKSKKKKMPTG